MPRRTEEGGLAAKLYGSARIASANVKAAMKSAGSALGDPLPHMTRNPGRNVGIAVLAILVFIAIMAPYISPCDPKQTGVPFLEPGGTHILGTDDLGRDIFSQVLYGTRISLLVGFLAATFATSIGVLVGLFAGYYRGIWEEILMGITDVYILIPGLALMIVLATYLEPSIWNIITVIGVLWWCPTARVIHSRALQVREMQFIKSTKAMGYSGPYIIFKHVLVNSKDLIMAKYSLAVASAMMAEASLSFLGLGDPTNVSWGGMINIAFNRGGFANDMWWWYLPPGLLICTAVVAFLLLTTQNRGQANLMEMV